MRRVATGHLRLDELIEGGFPEKCTFLVCGTAGTGKTIFGLEYLLYGAEKGEPGLYVSFEEPVKRTKEFMKRFGWDIDALESKRKLLLIDASIPKMFRGKTVTLREKFDLSGLYRIIEEGIQSIGAKRVVLDSISALLIHFREHPIVRTELVAIKTMLEEMGCTSLFVSEIPHGTSSFSRFGVEEFIADGVILLKYVPHQGKRRRFIEIYKMRGVAHASGDHPFEITDRGIKVFPRLKPVTIKPEEIAITEERVKTGIKELDNMLRGGFYRGDSVLVAGASGTGKTVLGLHFIYEGGKNGEPGVIVTFEEHPQLLIRNSKGLGFDLEALRKKGLLEVLYAPAQELCPDEHAIRIKDAVRRIGAKRVLIDSCSDLESIIQNPLQLRDHLSALVTYFRGQGITSILTTEIPEITGPFEISGLKLSLVTDVVILLRHVEIESGLKRALSIIKFRGSEHERDIREFEITSKGIEVKTKFKGMEGVMGGMPTSIEAIFAKAFKA
jgi:circadian clock protein KaiC